MAKLYDATLLLRNACVLFSVILLLLLDNSRSASGTRTKNKIYKELKGAVSCFRKLNGTGQYGCASDLGGNVGVLHVIRTNSDLNWLVSHGPHSPYVAAVFPDMLNKPIVDALRQSGKVNGVVLLANNTNDYLPDSFSQDQRCPNRERSFYASSPEYSGYCDSHPWNPHGTQLLHVDWGMPVFYVRQQEHIEQLLKWYVQFNEPVNGTEARHWPLCAIQLKAIMMAAVDTETCIRRSNLQTNFNRAVMCDAMGDRNIFAPLFARNFSDGSTPEPKDSVVVLAVPMDAMTLFDQVVPGADSVVTGLVTLLATARLLKRDETRFSDETKRNRNVLFAMFNGERADYIGSSAMVHEMINDRFPTHGNTTRKLNLSHLKAFIELNQVSNLSPRGKLFMHTDPVSNGGDRRVRTTTHEITTLLEKTAADYGLKLQLVGDGSAPLPPASMQSFLKKTKKLPGVVITDHNNSYVNRHYSGVFDTNLTLNYKPMNSSSRIVEGSIQQHLALLAATLKSALFELMTDQHDSPIIPPSLEDVLFVDTLLHCYLENGNCSLFNEVVAPGTGLTAGEPYSLYVGVVNSQNPITLLTRNLFAYLTGDVKGHLNSSDLCADTTEGKGTYGHLWVQGSDSTSTGVCIENLVRTMTAQSPAFSIDGYSAWRSGEYSTWTESRWKEFEAFVFLKPSRQREIVTFCVGLLVFVVSLYLAHLVTTESEVIFASQRSPPSSPNGAASPRATAHRNSSYQQ